MSRFEVVYSYHAPNDSHLTAHRFRLYPKEILTVMEKDASGWWIGRDSQGRMGIFPSTHVRICRGSQGPHATRQSVSSRADSARNSVAPSDSRRSSRSYRSDVPASPAGFQAPHAPDPVAHPSVSNTPAGGLAQAALVQGMVTMTDTPPISYATTACPHCPARPYSLHALSKPPMCPHWLPTPFDHPCAPLPSPCPLTLDPSL
eukprot:gene10588-1925_t